jgi:hypothetical protein
MEEPMRLLISTVMALALLASPASAYCEKEEEAAIAASTKLWHEFRDTSTHDANLADNSTAGKTFMDCVVRAISESKGKPAIGMTEEQVNALPGWEKPSHVSRMVVGGHTNETWMYSLKRMLGFQDGRLALINVAE